MNKLMVLIISFCLITAEDEFFEPSFTVGGYGELHYNNNTINDNNPIITLDFHRFITFVNYNYTPEWTFKSELELEHNYVADGDGELELEQAYVNYHGENWGFGVGVILISVGFLNEVHEPPTFFSVERPDYNKYIIPTTWFGNGILLYRSFGDFNTKIVLHEDLKGENLLSWNEDGTIDGFSGGIRDGRGKGFKTTAYNWTKNFSANYTGINGLTIGGSYTINDAPINKDKDNVVSVSLIEMHASYAARNFRTVFEYGLFSLKHDDLDGMNANGYYLDLGYNVGSLVGWKDCTLMPWFRYGSYTKDSSSDTNATDTWKVGITYWPIDKIAFKVDYGMDTKGDTETTEINIGVGYMF